MTRLMLLLLLTGCHCVCSGADELNPVPDAISTPVIRWPTTPATIPDKPIIRIDSNEPKPIDTLKADEFLVVESSVELFVRRFPAGMIDVEESVGPMRVRGKFAGGTGRIETREYGTGFLYFLTAIKSGVVGVDLVPIGVSAENDIARQVLTVVDGTQPLPPPGPEPEPDPKPQPTAKNVSVAIVEDRPNRFSFSSRMPGNPSLFGSVGTSHESRSTLIRHLLNDGIHRGRWTISVLNSMSDDELNEAHEQDHEGAK